MMSQGFGGFVVALYLGMGIGVGIFAIPLMVAILFRVAYIRIAIAGPDHNDEDDEQDEQRP